jgi:1-acyl-sn-glycerol-3-phosphate acyltransferase
VSDALYNLLWHIGNPAFWVSSSPIVINSAVTRRSGAYILAANHLSPYDVPLLMRHTARNLDFVSITEVFRNPLVAWLYGSMNAFPLERSRPDAPTVRTILDRLSRGRVVAMFPEGRIRPERESVVHGGGIRPGIGRIAAIAGVPVIPCVIINSAAYNRVTSWLPLRRTRYALIYGEPIAADAALGRDSAATQLEESLVAQFQALHAQLSAALPRGHSVSTRRT